MQNNFLHVCRKEVMLLCLAVHVSCTLFVRSSLNLIWPCHYALLTLFVGVINILRPCLVKPQLSRNPSNGEAIARKPAEAPYKKMEKKKSHILKSVHQKLSSYKIVL